jgi:hypothetical protein
MRQAEGEEHMTVTNKRLAEILTTAMEKPEIANALIQRVINTLNKQPEQPDFSKAGFGKPQREEGCAGCGKKASKGWALYCVKCTEREWVGLTDEQVDGYWDESVSTGCKLSFGMGVDYANRVLKEKNT